MKHVTMPITGGLAVDDAAWWDVRRPVNSEHLNMFVNAELQRGFGGAEEKVLVVFNICRRSVR